MGSNDRDDVCFQVHHREVGGSGLDVIKEVGGKRIIDIGSPFDAIKILKATRRNDRLVLHCRKTFIAALPFLALNRIIGRNRVAYNPHTNLRPSLQNIALLNLIVDKVICLSESNRKTLEANGLRNAIVIPNPIPTKRLEKYAGKKVSKKEYDFAWAGRNVGFKRLLLFLRCVEKTKGCRALVMTNHLDDEEAKLAKEIGRRLSVKLGLGDSDFFHELSKSKAYIFTSNDDEGLPVLLLETASLGMPIIATDTEKFREILLGEGIYWKDDADLIGIMKRVASGKAGLKSASKRLIAHYGTERITKMYNEW